MIGKIGHVDQKYLVLRRQLFKEVSTNNGINAEPLDRFLTSRFFRIAELNHQLSVAAWGDSISCCLAELKYWLNGRSLRLTAQWWNNDELNLLFGFQVSSRPQHHTQAWGDSCVSGKVLDLHWWYYLALRKHEAERSWRGRMRILLPSTYPRLMVGWLSEERIEGDDQWTLVWKEPLTNYAKLLFVSTCRLSNFSAKFQSQRYVWLTPAKQILCKNCEGTLSNWWGENESIDDEVIKWLCAKLTVKYLHMLLRSAAASLNRKFKDEAKPSKHEPHWAAGLRPTPKPMFLIPTRS